MLVNVYATVHLLPDPSFPHTLRGARDASDPELAGHLHGFAGYVMKAVGGKMTAHAYHLIQHIERVQHHLSVEVDDAQREALLAWVQRANAILFTHDGCVMDAQGRLLLNPRDGSYDSEAQVPYPRDALERKQRSDAALSQLGVRVPGSLPAIVSADEVIWRNPAEVARRALALLAVAVRAESLNSGEPWPIPEMRERLPRSFESLSPSEEAFMRQEAPPESEVVNHVWRYEALTVLCWALGVVPELIHPTAICDVQALVGAMMDISQDEFIAQAALRAPEVILDAADLHHRMHWATRQATQIEKSAPPASLHPGVVMERCYAFNWLRSFQNSDWDDVDTPT